MEDIIKMSDIISAGNVGYNVYTFSWELIDVCQYNCTYCSSMHFNIKTYQNIKDYENKWKDVIKLLSMPTIRNEFVVEILGGEPTLHPHIHEIVSSLCTIKKNRRVELVTNLAKPLDFYRRFDTPQNSKLSVEVSYHPEYYNEQWKQNVIDFCGSEHITVTPNVNLPDEEKWWPQTKDFLDILIQHDIHTGLNFLQQVEPGPQGEWSPNYTDKFWDYFSEYFHRDVTAIKTEIGFNNIKSDPGVCDGQMLKNVVYITNDNKQHTLSEVDINRHDLRQFKGWTCKPLMYIIDMKGIVTNHCTGDVITPVQMSDRHLSSCRTCPLDRCNCDTKFLYEKHK